MIFNVAQLLMEPVGASRTRLIDEPLPRSIGPGAQPLRGEVRFLRTDRSILSRVSLDASLETVCSRCLASGYVGLEIDFGEEFFPALDPLRGRHVELPEDAPEGFTIDEAHNLDLEEPLRQYVVTNQPLRTLCRPECAGLCPQCGTNRNQRACDCDQEQAASPWDALKALDASSQDGLSTRTLEAGSRAGSPKRRR